MDAKNVKEILGNVGSVHAGRLDRTSNCRDAGIIFCNGSQRFVLRANVFKIRIREIHAIARVALLPKTDDAIRLWIRKRAKKDTVDDAEDRRVGADAQCKREYGGHGIGGIF